jgi:hypothetical protein
MTQEIYSSISVNGFSNHRDLERLCLLFAHDVLDWINEGGLLDEEILHYGKLDEICDDYQNGDIDDEEALGGIGMEVQKLFSNETSFEGDTGHLVISLESWDDGCANEELFNAFCRFLTQYSDEDHYFENAVSNDGSTTVGYSVLHMKDKSTGTWMSSNSKNVLNRLLAMGSPDLIKALA